tara:strand:- start:252 stop:479 length:228 start_codon:yes stop_codon:yes gene_type:complete
MNNPQLNFDMISKILNIRMETKKEERLHGEALEEWKDKFEDIDEELTYYFVKEPSQYHSPIKVLEHMELIKLFDL